jgi:hypothetical protein
MRSAFQHTAHVVVRLSIGPAVQSCCSPQSTAACSYIFQPAAVVADMLRKDFHHPHMSARTAIPPVATAAARPDAAPGSLVSKVRLGDPV